MEITVELNERSYPIVLQRGILAHAAEYVNLQRNVLIVTDQGVPQVYVQTLQEQCKRAYVCTVQQGEGAKSFPVYEMLCKMLLEHDFSRKDCVVALGGGVVGDLAGFAAASYMRGIDFINIPTTTLSQIDSSIGGKVAINLEQVKNVIGAFYQPQAVLIDPDTLSTLPKRHFYNGLVEAVKAGLIYDAELFALFECADPEQELETILYRALLVKKTVVEQDEKEANLRKILNFGHTIGHGIESVYGLGGLLHGECVGLGMLPMIEDEALRARTKVVLEKLGVPTQVTYDPEAVYACLVHDKKASNGHITIVKVAQAGHAELQEVPLTVLREKLKGQKTE